MLIKVLTYILVCANIYLTDTKKVFVVTKKWVSAKTWTVRADTRQPNKRRLLLYYSRPTDKKKGGSYYVKNLFNKLRKVQRV